MKTLKNLSAKVHLENLRISIKTKSATSMLGTYQEISDFYSTYCMVKRDVTLDNIKSTILDQCLNDPKVFKDYFSKTCEGEDFDPYDLLTMAIEKGQLSILSKLVRKVVYVENKFRNNPSKQFQYACLLGNTNAAYELYNKHCDDFDMYECADAIHDCTRPGSSPYIEDELTIESSTLAMGLWIAFQLKHADIFDSLESNMQCRKVVPLIEDCLELSKPEVTMEHLDMLSTLKACLSHDFIDYKQKLNSFIESFRDRNVMYEFCSSEDEEDTAHQSKNNTLNL